MKILYRILAIVTLIAVCVGCATRAKTAYTTLSAVGIAVDNAMKGAAKAKVTGKMSDADWKRVAAAHDKFRAAYSLACDMAAQDIKKFAPADLLLIQTDLLTLIQTVTTK